ncbi:MAG: hypothetical protein ACRENW_05200 [Thermodesulfobacteriota bacterium]
MRLRPFKPLSGDAKRGQGAGKPDEPRGHQDRLIDLFRSSPDVPGPINVGDESTFPSQGGRDPHLDQFPFPSSQGSLIVAGVTELRVRLPHLWNSLLKIPKDLRLLPLSLPHRPIPPSPIPVALARFRKDTEVKGQGSQMATAMKLDAVSLCLLTGAERRRKATAFGDDSPAYAEHRGEITSQVGLSPSSGKAWGGSLLLRVQSALVGKPTWRYPTRLSPALRGTGG